jgi:Inner membrane protein YgaP-like, transmembrane domain
MVNTVNVNWRRKMFKTNIGGVERVIRVIAGAGIVSMAFIGPHSPWAYLGLVPLLTGLVGWCPPYAIFGVNTCSSCRR